MPAGTEFIKHEFDEAIAIQTTIVETGTRLASKHPVAAVQRQLKSAGKVDQRHLEQLKKFGAAYGAKGKREEVAEALSTLAEETSAKADSEESEADEAHAALLLQLKRKQRNSAEPVIKIARRGQECRAARGGQDDEARDQGRRRRPRQEPGRLRRPDRLGLARVTCAASVRGAAHNNVMRTNDA